MFFCRTNPKSVETLKDILQKYEIASGQTINCQKSAITFSKKTPLVVRERVKRELNISKDGGVGKYLGLPEHFGRKKRDLFSSIVDRIRQRALSWSSKWLSPAGKMTMLKSVLSAMPTYTMSCFKIHASLSKRIQSVLTRFWWDANNGKKKMNWIAWNKLTKSKKNGGLGFRDVKCFNDALLAKLSWRVLKNPDCLMARILLGKYCHNAHLLKCTAPASSSHGWKGILIGRDLLTQNLGWAIGDGKSINVWQDKWLTSLTQAAPTGPATEQAKDLKAEDLFLPNSSNWDREKIKRLVPQAEQAILMLKPSTRGQPDKRIWLKHPSGNYSTRSGYHSLRDETTTHSGQVPTTPLQWIPDIWAIKTAPKLQLFLWRIANGALPVGERLASRIANLDPTCKRCGEVESIPHCLFKCRFAQQVWSTAPFVTRCDPSSFNCFATGWKAIKSLHCLPPTGIAIEPLGPWICWSLWKERNNLIFNDKSRTPAETLTKAIVDAKEWIQAQPIKAHTLPERQVSLPRRSINDMHPDTILIRSDGAWKKEFNAAGIGWIFLKMDQSVISKHSQPVPFVNSPLMAEALALREAADAAARLGYRRVSFHSDSLQLINSISSGDSIAEIFGVLADISVLAHSFENVSFHFISRKFNRLADEQAKRALSVLAQTINESN